LHDTRRPRDRAHLHPAKLKRFSRSTAGGDRIATRADYEYHALMAGDDMVGVFGQFPPAALWR
jgi:hypothetical protein